MSDTKKYEPVEPASEEQSSFADVKKPVPHTNTVGTLNTDVSKRASVMSKAASKMDASKASSESNSATIAELYQYAEPVDYVLMFIGFFAAAGSGFCQPAFCLLFGTALDDLNSAGDIQTKINTLCVWLVVLGIGNLVTATVQTGCWGYTGERQAQKFREHYTRAVLRQEIGWFDSVGANQLATKLADLSGQLRDGMTYKTADFIQYMSQTVGAIIVGLALDPYVALIMFACTPLIGGTATVWIGAIASATKGSAELYAQAGGLATESLTNIRTVTALNAQPDVISNYRKFLLNVMEIGIQKGLRVGMATGLLWFVVLCTYAITLWYGSIQIADTIEFGYTDYPRAQTGGKVYAAFFACLMGAFGIGQIAPPVAAFTSARVAAKSFLEIIHREPLIDGLSMEGEKPEQRPVGEVELNDVVFAYPSRPEIEVCKGYNLKIRPGESCALVGASGSGKSTVINLLLRFYDPNSGVVRLDGRNIKELNTRWLRAQIGYVGQEPVLFSGSIADNIAYGLDATFAPELAVIDSATASPSEIERARQILRERVIEAATQANAHAFISALPQGYETDVGGSGSSMSGGQKQRIAIARALIKKPAVLLLDEATSALDAVSEKIVQESIDKLQKSKTQTTIIIAHRLSTIRNADKIAVVSKGVIAEEGTHDALIELDGIYADLVRLQMEAQQDENGDDPTQGISKLASINTLLRNEVEEVKSAEKNDVPASTEEAPESGVITVVKKLSEAVLEATTGHAPTAEEIADAKRAEHDPEFAAKLKEQQQQNKELMGRIWAMIYHHGGYFAVAVLGAVMVGAMFPLWGYIVGKSLGVLFLNDPNALRENAAKQAGYFVGLAGDAGIGAVLQMWGIFSLGERIVMKLRSDQFQAIIRREIGYFDKSENAVGEITKRLSDDARSVAKATGQTTASQIQALGCLAIGLILGFISCWKIGLVVLGALVPMVVSGAVKMMAYAGQLDALLFKGGDEEKSEHGIISTAFTQMRTVSAFSVQFRVAQVYNDITQEQTVLQKKKAWIVGIAKGAAELTTNWVFATLFFYAGVLLASGEFKFENVMEAILSLMFASFGLGQSLADLGDTKEALDAARRIFDTIEDGEKSPIDGLSLTGAKPTTRATGRIELSGVNFSYPTRMEAQVCRDYNLVIEPGEVVALVGPSGSGKSTIMNLLLRFYDPSSGDVKIDGIPIKDLNVRWLRSQIGYVGQEPVLFRGSIADNIARGRATYGDMPVLSLDEVMAAHLKASKDARIAAQKVKPADEAKPADGDVELGLLETDVDADIIDAAKSSYAHDFIMSFSDQYKTDVGESSMMVSGGQKQRIAIARALIKKPAVLLLDEATSALDATSERYVQESIDALQASKSQTTIVIAHRLTTIRNADKIAVINEGRVVEIGKHEELLAMNGLYAELWSKQVGINPSSSSQSLSGV